MSANDWMLLGAAKPKEINCLCEALRQDLLLQPDDARRIMEIKWCLRQVARLAVETDNSSAFLDAIFDQLRREMTNLALIPEYRPASLSPEDVRAATESLVGGTR